MKMEAAELWVEGGGVLCTASLFRGHCPASLAWCQEERPEVMCLLSCLPEEQLGIA